MKASLIELLVAALEQKYRHEPKLVVRELIQRALHGRISKQIAQQLAEALFWQNEVERENILTQIANYRLDVNEVEVAYAY